MSKKMNQEMKQILFANTRKMVIEEGGLTNPNNVLLALTVNRNLEKYGMTLDASAIRALSTQTAQEMSATWKEMESIVRETTGANAFEGELFYPNFPEEVMDKSYAELYLNALFYYTFSQSNDELSLAIANEIRSVVTEEKEERLPLLEEHNRELKVINKGTEKDLLKMMDARMHSLNMSEQQFEELKAFSKVYKKEFDEMLESETPFQSKETKVKIATMLHDEKRDSEIKLLLRDSIDVLRFAAMLSHRNGMLQNNVQLAPVAGGQKIAFKLSKAEKRLIRNLLNECKGLYTDLWRQEDLFKSLMNRLGTRKEDGCPERVTKAFDNLAKGLKVDENGRDIFNFDKLLIAGIQHLNETGDVAKLEKLAQNNPGEFLRAYTRSVESTKEEYRDLTIGLINHCVDSKTIALKDLLTAKEQLRLNLEAKEKMEQGEATVKIYKHHGKRYVTLNRGIRLSAEEVGKMREALTNAACEMVKGYQELGKVYVDPELVGVMAPGRDMRDASGGSVLTPYSTIDMDTNKNLLVFGIRWEKTKENPRDSWIDVDLSAHMYGKNYEDLGYVSYSRLKNHAMVHSGDYTSVPSSGSATEAILVDKERLREMGVKYVVAEVHCFSIQSFRKAGNCKFLYEQKEGQFGSYNNVNEMISKSSRNDGEVVFLGDTFEPSQLENCITLNSDAQTAIPLFYDVEEDRMHWLDLGIGSRENWRPHVTEDPKLMSSVMAEIELAKNNPYPSMSEVINHYITHNGELTQDITEANTVFVRQNVDREELGILEDARVITGFDLDVISKEFSGNDDQSMIVKNEPEKATVENEIADVKEPALVKQLRYLRSKLDEFPQGISWIQEEGLDIVPTLE